MIRHSVPHFPPSSRRIACWVAELNAALCLDIKEITVYSLYGQKKLPYLFYYNSNEEISSPMDLRYMKRIKFHLHLMGGWPFNELYEAYREDTKYIPLRHYKFLLVFYSIIFINSLFYLKFNINRLDFFKLGQVYIVIFMTAVALVSFFFLKSSSVFFQFFLFFFQKLGNLNIL